jgi:hypothetical protein
MLGALLAGMSALFICTEFICTEVSAQDPERYLHGTFARVFKSNPATALVVQVRATDGLHSFTLQERTGGAIDQTGSMRHFVGVERRATLDGTPRRASLSLLTAGDDRQISGFLYFTSRRHHRPHSFQFTLNRAALKKSQVHVAQVRRSSAPHRLLGCASHDNFLYAPAQDATTSHHAQERDPYPSTSRAVFTPTRILTVSTTADLEFYRRYGRNTQPYIQSVVAAADALYTTQVGIKLSVAASQIIRRGTASNVAFEAEDVLNSFRRTARQIRPIAAVNHLFTAKRLLSDTIGLAYIGTACRITNGYNASLSKAVNRALLPVVVAHEIAHNLGAVHESVPTSLMNPVPRANTTSFTEATLNLIQQYVATSGSCISSS